MQASTFKSSLQTDSHPDYLSNIKFEKPYCASCCPFKSWN